MADRLVHRGPDSAGIWAGDPPDVAFAHRRLAIVDLTEAGHQPMTSANRRWTITYNGELYNADQLSNRLGLDRSRFRGHSDTEVLLESIAAVGVERTLDAAIGMFAFAVFDSERDQLWLARDRFGEKPLYYASIGGTFVFASELQALRALPAFSAEIDRRSVVELLERSAISAPFTIFEDVFKLESATYALVDRSGQVDTTRYYDPTGEALGAEALARTDEEAVLEFEELLAGIVQERMISDVPLGAFLSGGIDSSLIVTMMQRVGSSPARTFTIGFESPDLNEAPAAKVIATALGTEHHEWIVTGADALAIVPQLGALYDEPFADPSQVPTTLVSRFARQQVTVALSGDGGDELFGGYPRYQLLARAQGVHRLPASIRRSGARAMTLVSEELIDRIARGRAGALLPGPFERRTGKRIHTAASMLRASGSLDLYDLLIRPHRLGPALVAGGARRDRPLDHRRVGDLAPIELGMALDTIDYLPNDILTKVDRASMSTSLEVRAPMLDPRLHQFAWSLTPDQRVRDGHGKWLLRETVRRHVPEIAGLPKRGFGVPLDDWLRGPLQMWGRDLLNPTSLARSGVFNLEEVQRLWSRHVQGEGQHGAEIWPILMFQAWHTNWMHRAG
jgi:asparagine synthase (glutamine-hydrolysing)